MDASLSDKFAAASADGKISLFVTMPALGNGIENLTDVLEQHPDFLNKQDKWSATALMVAASYGRNEQIALLLERGARVDLVDCYGDTAFGRALEKGYTQAAEMLLDHGSDIEHKNKEGKTPMALAALRRNERAICFLLEHDAFVDQENPFVMRPLVHVAALALPLAQLLLEKIPALLDYQDERGRTVAMLAEEWGRPDVVGLVKEKEHKRWLAETNYARGLPEAKPAKKPLEIKSLRP